MDISLLNTNTALQRGPFLIDVNFQAGILGYIIGGVLAGLIVGNVLSRHRFGLVGKIILGIIGVFAGEYITPWLLQMFGVKQNIAAWLLPLLGVKQNVDTGLISTVIAGLIGSIIVFLFANLLFGKRGRSGSNLIPAAHLQSSSFDGNPAVAIYLAECYPTGNIEIKGQGMFNSGMVGRGFRIWVTLVDANRSYTVSDGLLSIVINYGDSPITIKYKRPEEIARMTDEDLMHNIGRPPYLKAAMVPQN